MFRNVTITFRYPNGLEQKFTVELGETFSMQWVPKIPPKSGHAASWAGLEEEDLEKILFDMTYEVEYTGANNVLRSDLAEGEYPVMLVQGIFGEAAQLRVEPADPDVTLKERESVLLSWKFAVTEAEQITQVRVRLPEGHDGSNIKLLLGSSDTDWREADVSVEGSYAAASLQAGENRVVLVETNQDLVLPVILGVSALILIVVLLIERRKDRKR